MSQSPVQFSPNPDIDYFNAWQELATRIRAGNSFSGREANCAFLNTGGTRFADISKISGFGFEDDARALALTDWDGDGDLDVWTTNRTAPRLRFLQNKSANANRSIMLQLEGDPGRGVSRDAIGARVTVTTNGTPSLISRTLSAGSGFLSQSSKRLHIGLGQGAKIKLLQVQWPGIAGLETFKNIQIGKTYLLRQGRGSNELPSRSTMKLVASNKSDASQGTSTGHRVRLVTPAPFPPPRVTTPDGTEALLRTRSATLYSLWASWCPACQRELKTLQSHSAQLRKAGLAVQLLNVEGLDGKPRPDANMLTAALKKSGIAIPWAYATPSTLETLDTLREPFLYSQKPLPLPTSFLVDATNHLIAVYFGELDTQQLIGDVRANPKDLAERKSLAAPLPGRWSTANFITNPVAVARVYLEGGYVEDARSYLEKNLQTTAAEAPGRQRDFRMADMHYMLAETLRAGKKAPETALSHLDQALKLNPAHPRVPLLMIEAHSAMENQKQALEIARRIARAQPRNGPLHEKLGLLLFTGKDPAGAVPALEKAIALDPRLLDATSRLAWIHATSKNTKLFHPKKSLLLARRLISSGTVRDNPHRLDTIAAAFAANGDFKQAITHLNSALEITKKYKDQALTAQLTERLSLYNTGKPYRE